MEWQSFGLGVAIGIMAWRAFSSLAIGLRPCCAAHFKTHAKCECWACREDREAAQAERGAA